MFQKEGDDEMKPSVLEFVVGSVMLAFVASWCFAIDESSYDVILHEGKDTRVEGKLSFTDDEIAFEASNGM